MQPAHARDDDKKEHQHDYGFYEREERQILGGDMQFFGYDDCPEGAIDQHANAHNQHDPGGIECLRCAQDFPENPFVFTQDGQCALMPGRVHADLALLRLPGQPVGGDALDREKGSGLG